jgi:hypothetical protein
VFGKFSDEAQKFVDDFKELFGGFDESEKDEDVEDDDAPTPEQERRNLSAALQRLGQNLREQVSVVDSAEIAAGLSFTDTSSMGFDDHEIEYFKDDEGTYLRLDLGKQKAGLLQRVTFILAMCDEEGTPAVFLGEDFDLDADWGEGIFTDSFRGVWGSIDGHIVSMEVVSVTDDYILYEIPILIKGRFHTLTVAYDYASDSFKMLTAKLSENETGGIPGKDQRLLAPGDEITTVLLKLDQEKGETVPMEGETFKITKKSAFEEIDLDDGNYALMFMMTDYRNAIYPSEMAHIILEDGKVTVYDPNS